MKIVKLEISASQRKELEYLRNNGSKIIRERSLAILHCADGRKITWIAKALNRQIQTIRTWVNRFRMDGVRGLERKYSPGRPSTRNSVWRPMVWKYLSSTPQCHGWKKDCWTMVLLREQIRKDTGKNVSISTLERVLKDCGYSYKRPPEEGSATAPSMAEKLERIKAIAREIIDLNGDGDCDIQFAEESHFPMEPCVIRGWYCNGEKNFTRNKSQQAASSNFWRVQIPGKIIFLEERREERQDESVPRPSIAPCRGRKPL